MAWTVSSLPNTGHTQVPDRRGNGTHVQYRLFHQELMLFVFLFLFLPHFSGGSRNWKGGFSGECSEQRCEALISLPRKARKHFFAVIFQLPGWAVVAPLCFALHCHCSLVSVQSVTVCITLALDVD